MISMRAVSGCVRMSEEDAERLTQQLECHRRQQQDDLPIRLDLSQHVPDVLVQVDEDKRRELPDHFLRARLAQTAAGEAAAHGKRQGDEFTGDDRRDGHHGADQGTGVGAGNQAGEQRAFEGQVRRVIVEQHPEGDAGHQRHPD
jgi:hypothetical protein